jgi:LPS export ABC transporter protein LptC
MGLDPGPVFIMTLTSTHKLIYPLIGILVMICLIVAGYFVVDTMLSRPVTVKDVKIDTQAVLKLNVLQQISKKNGIKEWSLTADTATVLKDENRAVLNQVKVTFFTKDNKQVLLVSDKGSLNTKTHDMTFSDNVVLTYEDAVMKTQKLHYNKKEHIIYADSKVRLEKQDSVIEADSMTTQLNTNTTTLKGHVKGLFSEDFKIE